MGFAADVGTASWLHTFQPYSATHLAVVAGFTLATAAVVALGRRWRGDPVKQRRLDVCLAAAGLMTWVWVQAFGLMPWRYEHHKALPLQICDLVGFLAPAALFTRWRPLRALLYFWGIGLSTQGFFQPDLREGPADPSFWAFWLGHMAIVGASMYDVFARGYRPTWADYGVACAAAAGYLAVILPVDLIFDFNYGYVGRGQPGQPSLVDFLGPWPGRVAIIGALAAVVMALLMLPWELARWWRRKEGDKETRRQGDKESTSGGFQLSK
jgi:hypothetical integral membrane protein (TIGR02206 family)